MYIYKYIYIYTCIYIYINIYVYIVCTIPKIGFMTRAIAPDILREPLIKFDEMVLTTASLKLKLGPRMSDSASSRLDWGFLA